MLGNELLKFVMKIYIVYRISSVKIQEYFFFNNKYQKILKEMAFC